MGKRRAKEGARRKKRSEQAQRAQQRCGSVRLRPASRSASQADVALSSERARQPA